MATEILEGATLVTLDRDPANINVSVKVLFEDVLAEPEGAHSALCVWNLSHACYNSGKNCCYLFLTYLCAAPAALCWGCGFACLSCQYIWCFTPLLKCLEVAFSFFQKVNAIFVNSCCVPIVEVFSRCFSKIKVSQG